MKYFSAAPGRLLVIAAALLTLSCSDSPAEPPPQVEFDATVQVLVLEGPDAFLLHPHDRPETYYPTNLPAAFHTEGAQVHVRGFLPRYQVYLMQTIELLEVTAIP